ncbi:hypothetical protein [Streptomyces sp. 891-h]|uniref:hypothetical protein n=1 Tax=Streptomyces sp. 891-h TaxID=2720714 RepID=UPI001FAAFF2A|nr:hypothetical protein [Streptomyces sp. 891-h]UNZ19702.1 hypothetical protein HC362_24340 [Streptomyces sp. 891-h]
MSRTSRLALIIGTAVVSGVAALVVAMSLLADATESDLSEQEKKCCWKKGVTAASLSRELGVRLPDEASDRRAAFKIGSRYDTALLSFTLPTGEAKKYVATMKPSDEELITNQHPEKADYRPMAPFSRLHLPEPETLTKGLRMASLCPDSAPLGEVGQEPPGLKRLNHCIRLFTHEYEPGATRLYIKSDIE